MFHPLNCRMSRLYMTSVVVVLAATGLIKVFTSLGEVHLLSVPHALFPFLTHRQLLMLSGVLELVTVIALLRIRQQKLKLLLVAWLAALFGTYRFGLWWAEVTEPCLCFGNILDWLHLDRSTSNALTTVLFYYILLGSFFFLLVGPSFREVCKRSPRNEVSSDNDAIGGGTRV